MADHPFTVATKEYYDNVNVTKCLVTRFNKEDLTSNVGQMFHKLSKNTTERYLGSGIVIPENVKGHRILDIGCGTGSMTFILSKLVGPSGHIVGIDISPGLLSTAKSECEYNLKALGNDANNIEFHLANAENLLEKGFEKFDTVVSNGVFCLIPDQPKAFKAVAALLKPGGQFYINDVYTQTTLPEEVKQDQNLFALGAAGTMMWSELQPMVAQEGFTTPYLTQAYPVEMKDQELYKKLNYAEFACAAYRLFHLPEGASRGAATVTYKGNIEDHEESLVWDVDLTFKKGEKVNVDAELATVLAFSNYKDNFDFEDFSGDVTSQRNQNPFSVMEKRKAAGTLGDFIYAVEDH